MTLYESLVGATDGEGDSPVSLFQDTGRCPGAFHVGCQDDPHDSTSTMSMSTSTDPEGDGPTTPGPGNGSTALAVNWKFAALAFVIVGTKL